MDDNVRAVLEGLEQHRRGHRIIDDKRHAVAVRGFGKFFNIADVAGRISDRFAKDGSCIFIDQPLD